MEEVVQYLLKRINDLEDEGKRILNTNFDLRHTNRDKVEKIMILRNIIKYIYGELNAYDFYIPDEAKEELIKYIERNMECLDEEDTNINR